MDLYFSFIIPVYNRPHETLELLKSFQELEKNCRYEIIIVEDGSAISSKNLVADFNEKLNISYLFKEKSGPGDSRNFGMQHAKGNYFITLDSDCTLPQNYLIEV